MTSAMVATVRILTVLVYPVDLLLLFGSPCMVRDAKLCSLKAGTTLEWTNMVCTECRCAAATVFMVWYDTGTDVM